MRKRDILLSMVRAHPFYYLIILPLLLVNLPIMLVIYGWPWNGIALAIAAFQPVAIRWDWRDAKELLARHEALR